MSALENPTNGVEALKCTFSLASTGLAPTRKYTY